MWPSTLRRIDLTHPAPEENLAFDQALLESVEADPSLAALRFWESPSYAVIIGRSNVIEREVNVPACTADHIPILRRMSGGGAVLLGPGCLCYSLALPLPEHNQRNISAVTMAIMQRLRSAFDDSLPGVEVRGISDLVFEDRKFSGNSQRWLKRTVLHHGTVLYDFDLERIERYLHLPGREPDYRAGRSHTEFVRNVPLDRSPIAELIAAEWGCAKR